MRTAQEILSQHREGVPPWLFNCTETTPLNAELFGEMLQSRVVYYPGAGVNDGETFEVFTHPHAAHCVIHADQKYSAKLVSSIVNREVRGPYTHVAGYRPLAQKQLDRDEFQGFLGLVPQHSSAEAPASLGGAFWAILEREQGKTDEYGPSRIAFLHVHCEAVWLFQKLWCQMKRSGPFSILLHDHGYGGNWTSFGAKGELCRLAAENNAFPDWLLVANNTIAWPNYQRQSDETPWITRLIPDEHGDTRYSSGRRVLYCHAQEHTAKPTPKE